MVDHTYPNAGMSLSLDKVCHYCKLLHICILLSFSLSVQREQSKYEAGEL